jgi:hypothetical protein
MKSALTLLLSCSLLVACSGKPKDPVTLYRNSQLDHNLRVQFATFDAADGTNYNLSNCQMASRVLNANMDSIARASGGKRDEALGFWCEIGRFEDHGLIPVSFESELPTEAR